MLKATLWTMKCVNIEDIKTPWKIAVNDVVELDDEIPAGLYLAVAQILTYVYQLRSWQAVGGDYPEAPEPDVDDIYLKDLL